MYISIYVFIYGGSCMENKNEEMKRMCHHCKKLIIGDNYLGNKETGFIHLSCVSLHINKNKQRVCLQYATV